jgi:hypothetical protein
MSGAIINLIIQLVAGALGGNAAGAAMKQYDLGTLGNSIAGIVGGGLGGQLVAALLGGGAAFSSGASGGALDLGSIIQSVLGGGVGGGVLMVIVGLIRQMMGGHAQS